MPDSVIRAGCTAGNKNNPKLCPCQVDILLGINRQDMISIYHDKNMLEGDKCY